MMGLLFASPVTVCTVQYCTDNEIFGSTATNQPGCNIQAPASYVYATIDK